MAQAREVVGAEPAGDLGLGIPADGEQRLQNGLAACWPQNRNFMKVIANCLSKWRRPTLRHQDATKDSQ
jgi:hypothetical protein